MSTKELCRSVVDGRVLTLYFGDGSTLVGYLCGIDDFTYRIVDANGNIEIIHKTGAPRVRVGEARYDEEQNKDTLERVVRPFREWVLTNQYGRQEAS